MYRGGKLLLLITCLLAGACGTASLNRSAPEPHGSTTSTLTASPRVVLYATAWCPGCKAAKDYFAQRQIAYELRDVELDEDALHDLQTRYRTNRVPLIVIGNDAAVLNGFNPELLEKTLREINEPVPATAP